MDIVNVAFLINEIQALHGCDCRLARAVRLTQQYKGRVLWEGVVGIFQLHGHPTASECYAWSTDELQGMADPAILLKSGVIDSPAAAVRAHIRQLCLEMAA